MKEFTTTIHGKSVDCIYCTADECEVLKKEVADIGLESYTWGSFGRNGDEQVQVRRLVDLETDHLENILLTQPSTVEYLASKAAILQILKSRYKDSI